MFGNMFDVRRQQSQDLEKSAMDFASLPRGRAQVAAAGIAGGLGGRAITGALGMQTPEEMRVVKSQQIKQNALAGGADKNDPQTYIDLAAELEANGLTSDAKMALEIAEAMKDQRKERLGDIKRREKRESIQNYAERVYGQKLPESMLNEIASFSKDKDMFSSEFAKTVHPWKGYVDQYFSEIGVLQIDPKAAKEPIKSTVQFSDKTNLTDEKALKTLNENARKDADDFKKETEKLSGNIQATNVGFNLINQIRQGNYSSVTQLNRILSTIIGDDRISQPEIQATMSVGGLGTRIADSITKFLQGTYSEGTINDIEQMFTALNQYYTGTYNEKSSKYINRYKKEIDSGLTTYEDLQNFFDLKQPVVQETTLERIKRIKEEKLRQK